ncbi:methyl-CpG-binding domain protein 3 isoform X3 [Ornithorhynchus anatinus]|uniref:Methyl-CpG binding domain protein 3 n=1 Tax=Ornithorhynchus anatinus TaxID=9258 RepID=A0A6I8P0X0_ORNAN|nr:methyl-CpG-binding domain protein 3 isoform X3 [Ornithorhynchus anatinus]
MPEVPRGGGGPRRRKGPGGSGKRETMSKGWSLRGLLPGGRKHCTAQGPSGKKFRSKPQLARYLGSSMDLSTFDFRTGKMLMSKMNKNRQRMRYDCSSQAKGKPDLNTALPVRQTASIFKQPVTKITNHPSNKVKSDPQKAVDQPRQLFWEKKLSGLNAFDIAEELVKTMDLPKGLQGVGPGCTDETLLSAIASALHTSTMPITGQLSAAVEKNPGVWLNTSQPLCKAFMVTDEDIRGFHPKIPRETDQQGQHNHLQSQEGLRTKLHQPYL